MARFGIDTSDAYGVPHSRLRPMARRIGRDHSLALRLWDTGVREARLLAVFIADPKLMTRAQMDAWVGQIASWDICDGACNDLFRKTRFAWQAARAWSRRKPEFVRRAGFVMMAVLAVHDKQAPDRQFLVLLPRIEAAASDDRNFVKKAVNWALRQIGKRNSPALWREASRVAERLAASDSPAARWVGRDALREFARLSASSRTPRS
jgi:3-methyladenine DNA glycosylase AlkD